MNSKYYVLTLQVFTLKDNVYSLSKYYKLKSRTQGRSLTQFKFQITYLFKEIWLFYFLNSSFTLINEMSMNGYEMCRNAYEFSMKQQECVSYLSREYWVSISS